MAPTPVPGPPRHSTLIEVEAREIDRMLKEADVMGFTIRCDEPPHVGGDNAEPAPLAYFGAALAFCLMTQVARYAHLQRTSIRNIRASVRLHFATSGSVLGHTVEAHCDRIETHLSVESDADQQAVRQVIADAERGCYVAQSIRHPVDLRLDVSLNGRSLANADGGANA